MLQLCELVAQYANEYETDDGMMTLRDLIRDGETSTDFPVDQDIQALSATIKWH